MTDEQTERKYRVKKIHTFEVGHDMLATAQIDELWLHYGNFEEGWELHIVVAYSAARRLAQRIVDAADSHGVVEVPSDK